MELLGTNNNVKTIKSDNLGTYLTAILYLSPHKISGKNLCPHATAGCAAACLYTAGMGKFSNVHQARLKKTQLFLTDKNKFVELLKKDISNFIKNCNKKHKIPAIRLNGTSDLPWENIIDMSKYNAQFYDYTKSLVRMMKFCQGKMPSNYHLTFSKAENNWDKCEAVLANSGNVAAVFKNMPQQYQGYSVYNGDDHDLRFTDPKGVIVGLKAKGDAKKDTTGFVI